MKLLVLGAVMGAMVVGTLPASAQVVVRDRDDGVVIRQHSDSGRHLGWRHHRAECRVVKVTKTLPNGNRITKTRRTCY